LSLDGYQTTDLHALVLTEVEKPLFEATFQYAGYNQTKTAQILGISRSTLVSIFHCGASMSQWHSVIEKIKRGANKK
jgi:hypothetical protein